MTWHDMTWHDISYIHTFIHSYIHTFIHSYIHTFIHSYIHTFIHSYIHTFIHSYIHTYIHTYTRRIHILCTQTGRKNQRQLPKKQHNLGFQLETSDIYVNIRSLPILYPHLKTLPVLDMCSSRTIRAPNGVKKNRGLVYVKTKVSFHIAGFPGFLQVWNLNVQTLTG